MRGETLGQKLVDYYENGLTAVFTIGGYGSVNLGAFNLTGSVEIAFDLKGNMQVVGSIGFDVTTSGSLSASGGICTSAYIMPDTSYLAGDTYYLGGSIFVPDPGGIVSAGCSGNVGVTSDGYGGVSGSLGIGTVTAIGVDVHGGYTHTTALTDQYSKYGWLIKLISEG